jgi:hypothetical protein
MTRRPSITSTHAQMASGHDGAATACVLGPRAAMRGWTTRGSRGRQSSNPTQIRSRGTQDPTAEREPGGGGPGPQTMGVLAVAAGQ